MPRSRGRLRVALDYLIQPSDCVAPAVRIKMAIGSERNLRVFMHKLFRDKQYWYAHFNNQKSMRMTQVVDSDTPDTGCAALFHCVVGLGVILCEKVSLPKLQNQVPRCSSCSKAKAGSRRKASVICSGAPE